MANEKCPGLSMLHEKGFLHHGKHHFLRDTFSFVRGEDKVLSKVKIHHKYGCTDDRFWYGVNPHHLTLVDYVMFWAEWRPTCLLVPSAVLQGIYDKMTSTFWGEPKIDEQGRWHLNVSLNDGGRALLKPVNYRTRPYPDLSKFLL